MLALDLAYGIIETIDVVPVGVGAHSATAGARRSSFAGNRAAEAERRYESPKVLAARGERGPRLIHVPDEVGIRFEVVERRRIAHVRPAHLGLVVRVVVPRVIALAKRELVDHGRADGVGDPNAPSMPRVRVVDGGRHKLAR